jgi:predicted alpha/beta superfamily hydrolase
MTFLAGYAVGQPLPKVTSGKITRLENFQSKFVEPRHVDVWLPDGYNLKTKYAVLYMHDGQMLFDSATAWNKQSWNVDDVAANLMKASKLQQFIVVGIWNSGKTRHADYFPQKPFDALSADQRGIVVKQLQEAQRSTEIFQPNSDNYLKFLVKELKPYIDKTYHVYKDSKHTFVAGSSMGGLISMYAICEYPEIFGGAACMSTHWPGSFSAEHNPVPDAFINYLKSNLPDPENHKIYFDYGDQTLDAMYPLLQQRVDEVMKSKDFTGKNWITKFYPGENHSEKAWNSRLDSPLIFLLEKD